MKKIVLILAVFLSFSASSSTFDMLSKINCDNLAQQTFRSHYLNGSGLSWDRSMEVAETSHKNCMEDPNGYGSDWSRVKERIEKLH